LARSIQFGRKKNNMLASLTPFSSEEKKCNLLASLVPFSLDEKKQCAPFKKLLKR